MQDKEILDYDGLREAARNAVKASDLSQNAIAKRMGVTSGAMSRALNESDASFAKLLRGVVSMLTDFRVEDESTVVYRAYRKG